MSQIPHRRSTNPTLLGKPARSIELIVGAETIGVWLDESGIHFRQAGVVNEGLIPWSTALAVSMLPDGVMRLGALALGS